MSYVLQVIEDKIITNAVAKLRQKGYVVDTLCFDGVLVNGIDIGDDLLEELSAYCFETTEYRVEFSVKHMVKHYEFAEEQYDCSDYEFMHLDEYNQVYCVSLTGDTPKEIYEIRKAYIEKFLCKLQQPEPMYIFQNGIHTKVDPQNPTQIALLLKPITSGYFKTNGDPISFYDKWAVDVKHRLYIAIDYIPFNIDKPIDDSNIYNVFEGFNPDIYGEAMEHEIILNKITPYLDLVNALCDGEENASYFHKFIANIFQDPSNKPPVAIIFKGKQGTGKNMVLDAIGNMLNKTHHITSSKPSDFFGEQAEGYYRKFLVNLNEAEGKDTFDFEGIIKSLTSEDTMTITPKNVRPTEIANHPRTIVTTQKPSPVAIDVKTKDRRWIVFQTTDLYLKKFGKFWTGLYKHLRKPETMKALYQYFMSIDLTDFDWIKRRPMTKAYKEMCNLFSPIEELFFEEFYDKHVWMNMGISGLNCEEITVPMQDLFVEYESFCKIQKAIEINEKYDWVKNLQKLISNINNTQHRITRFTPKQIKTAFKNDDNEVLDEAYENELKTKQGNISKQVFKIRYFVRLYLASDKTRQTWSDEIYQVEKVFKPKKSYSVYEYKLKEFPDRFKEEELLKVEQNPQNKIVNVKKFVKSRLVKPVIEDNKIYYEVKWKNYNEGIGV